MLLNTEIGRNTLVGASLVALGGILSGCGFNSWAYSFDHDSTRIVELEAQATRTLRVVNEIGDVRIVGSAERDNVHAYVELVGLGTTPEEADARLAELSCEIVVLNGELVARLVHPEVEGNVPYAGRWAIEVPIGTDVIVRSDVGDVSVVGAVGGVDLVSDVGALWVDGARGMALRTDVGDIHARGSGRIDAKTDVGDVVLCVLGTSAHKHSAWSDVGDVTVVLSEGWEGLVTAKTDVGSAQVIGDRGTRFDGEGKVTLRRGTLEGSTLLARTDVGSVRVGADGDHRVMGDEPRLRVPLSGEDSTARESTAGQAAGD